MTTPINPVGFAELARGRGFGERPGPLVSIIIFLPLAIALLCAATVVLFNDRWIAIVFEGFATGRDLWAGVWIFLILGIASLATVVAVIANTIRTSRYASSMLINVAQIEDGEGSAADVNILNNESGFGKSPGPVATVAIFVVLCSAILSAALTQWLATKAYGLDNGIFKGIWGGVYVFFALSLVCLGIAIAVAANSTRRPKYFMPNPANYQFQNPMTEQNQPISEQPSSQQAPATEVSDNIEDEKLSD